MRRRNCWTKTNFDMANTNKTITFHNTPTFYLEYTNNWLAHQRKAKANPAEIAIVEDIHKLVEIAVGVLEPIPTKTEPAEPAK